VARYHIDPDRSRVWIDARSSVHPIHSTTDGLEGFVDLEPKDTAGLDLSDEPAGKLSLRVDRLSSGNRLEDRELQRRIDARRYPTIDGVLTGIERTDGDGRYRVTGDLAFRGVVRRCEDDMVITVVDDRTLRLEGQSTFDIRDFGMDPPRILMLRVEPEVAVRVEIVAERDESDEAEA
jgi:polyisoprenoid-binding protein YceI